MPRHNGDIINADRAARKGHGVTNFVNEMQDVSIFKTCKMGTGPSPTPTVWMSHDDPRYVDEWARVQEMRRKSPNGLVAGGKCTPYAVWDGENDPYDHGKGLSNSRRAFSGLRGKGQGLKNQEARHFCSN